MIYYYFGGKEQLYTAVLESAYARIRAAEQRVDVDHLDPVSAIRRLAELTFDHHESHPDFIRLVSAENIHSARHMSQSKSLIEMNSPAVELLERILARGRAAGSIRRDVDAVDVHMLISAFCFFRMANQHTFGTLFGRRLTDPKLRARYRAMVGDLVVDYLTSSG